MSADIMIKHTEDKKGLNWPYVIVGFFAVVFAMNAYLIFTAYKNFDGLADENYYQKGLFYDAHRAEARNIGWSFGLDLGSELEVNKDIPFVLSVLDKEGVPLKGAAIVATLRRLTTDKYDVAHVLTEGKAGYSGVMRMPLAGKWEVFVEAEKDGKKVVKRFNVEL